MKNNDLTPLKARVCYGHLGGTLGERILQRFIELDWLERDGEKATVLCAYRRGPEAVDRAGNKYL
jgi:hypothetical protein